MELEVSDIDQCRLFEKVENYKTGLCLREKQKDAFFHIMEKKGDLLVSLPVGYGKSILFHLMPKVLGVENPIVIVISPLNIIQKDQLKQLKQHNITACRLDIAAKVAETSDVDDVQTYKFETKSDENIQDVINGKFSIVLCHPEALLNTSTGKSLISNDTFRQKVAGVVIDECHVIEEWGQEFRTAFKSLGSLKVFLPKVPFVALSGTLTVDQKREIPKYLNLKNYAIIESSPDKPNIFFQRIKKEPKEDVLAEYEAIVHKVCDQLFLEKDSFPVTLLFLPVFYMSESIMYLNSLFGSPNINTSLYSALCSAQDEFVIDTTITELKKNNPRIRLVLTTSISGMGFDPDNVTRVIHTCPPRNISQYLQEVGRAGRRGQPAKAILYYNNRNIAKNLPGITDDMISYCKTEGICLRNKLLSTFGFEKNGAIVGCMCCSLCKIYLYL